MAKKKRIDPVKQREKRAKIIAGVGGLLLVGIGFVEVPSVMKQLNAKPPAASVPAPVAATTTPGASLGLPSVGGAPAAATSSSGLTDTDAPPVVSSAAGQLVTFDAFEMKNPFKPQVSSSPVNPNPPDPTPTPGATTPSGATTAGTVVPATGATASPAPTTSTPATPLSILDAATGLTPPAGTTGSAAPAATAPPTTAGAAPTTTTPTPATTPTVAISVNGSVSRVGTAGTFPAGAPVFRLASWQHGSATISIVGGSYATGGATLTLRLNTPVTLQNTHDGKQYKLVLVSTP